MSICETYSDFVLAGALGEAVAVVAFFVAFLGLVTACHAGCDCKKRRDGGACFLVAAVIMFLGLWLGTSARANGYECLSDCVSSGYSVYYNGEEVDGTKITFKQYEISINEEKEEIYLADKPARSRFIPVVIPR